MLTYQTQDEVIDAALQFIEGSLRQSTDSITSSTSAKSLFFKLFNAKMGRLEHEEMHVALLNSQHELIGTHCMGRGTINQCALYPREFVKLALIHNAQSIIMAHNHPSGDSMPSRADIHMTKRVKDALALIDVDVLDHIIVAGSMVNTYSMVEHGDISRV